MGVKAIENIGNVKTDLLADDLSKSKIDTSKQENLSELLAGNNSTAKNTQETSKPKESTINKILDGLTTFNVITGFVFLLALTPFGKRTVSNVISFLIKRNGLKRLKKVRANMPNFKNVSFVQSKSPSELKKMAKRLGVKIKFGSRLSEIDLIKYNNILEILTAIHNRSKGRIKLPKIITMDNFGLGIKGYAGIRGIKLNKMSFDSETIFHEIGHVNHFERGRIAYLDGLLEFEKAGIKTSEIENFYKNPKLKQEITKNIGEYATTSPAEFVAEVFAHKMKGEPVPPHLQQLYAKFKGTPRVPVIEGYSTMAEDINNNFHDFLNSLVRELKSADFPV